MEPESFLPTSLLEFGVASRALQGQTQSGDRHLVEPYPDGVLAAVVDGLGHGAEAAHAAESAVAILREHAGEPIVSLLKRCHDALLGTRGVVISLASISAAQNMMTWTGVGDVEGVLIHAAANARSREFVLQRGGVVGFRLPAVNAITVPVISGDLLIFATDGVSRAFAEEPASGDSPAQIANRLLARHAKGTDDALVLVARYLGATS